MIGDDARNRAERRPGFLRFRSEDVRHRLEQAQQLTVQIDRRNRNQRRVTETIAPQAPRDIIPYGFYVDTLPEGQARAEEQSVAPAQAARTAQPIRTSVSLREARVGRHSGLPPQVRRESTRAQPHRRSVGQPTASGSAQGQRAQPAPTPRSAGQTQAGREHPPIITLSSSSDEDGPEPSCNRDEPEQRFRISPTHGLETTAEYLARRRRELEEQRR